MDPGSKDHNIWMKLSRLEILQSVIIACPVGLGREVPNQSLAAILVKKNAQIVLKAHRGNMARNLGI